MEGVFRYLRELNMASMMLRVVLAMIVGGTVGFEREKKGRAAGFRTYMLVATGAAMTMILSQYLDLLLKTFYREAFEIVGQRTDVVRLGAQVISGIGFLGTGTIMVTSRQEVKGLTTAAGLWASACIGLAVGAGFYEGVLVSYVLIVLSVRVLPPLESYAISRSRNMSVYLVTAQFEQMTDILHAIKQSRVTLYNVDIDRHWEEGREDVSAILSLRLPKNVYHGSFIASLAAREGVITVDEI